MISGNCKAIRRNQGNRSVHVFYPKHVNAVKSSAGVVNTLTNIELRKV